jgi:hypothetical protein
MAKDQVSDGASAGEEGQKSDPATNEETLTKAQVDELLAQEREVYEGHVSKVRSDLMRANAQREKEFEERDQAYQQRIMELEMKDLDDSERAVYEARAYKERMHELEQRLDSERARARNAENMGAYISGLAQGFGVDIKDLDMSSPEALTESGFTAAASNFQEAQSRIDELQGLVEELKTGKSQAPVEEPKVKDAPDVVTGITGESGTGAPTLMDLRKSVSKRLGVEGIISEEELFELAERPEETGVDLNQVLPAIEAELADLEKQSAS